MWADAVHQSDSRTQDLYPSAHSQRLQVDYSSSSELLRATVFFCLRVAHCAGTEDVVEQGLRHAVMKRQTDVGLNPSDIALSCCCGRKKCLPFRCQALELLPLEEIRGCGTAASKAPCRLISTYYYNSDPQQGKYEQIVNKSRNRQT